MSALFEELDYRLTPIGPISLRRRRSLSLGEDIFEIMLGDEHLMSSLFTASEVELARLALADLEHLSKEHARSFDRKMLQDKALGHHSVFDETENALANRLQRGRTLDIVVGGLGLGYTARAVLDHATVQSLVVVELLDAVIDWHRDGLLPLDPPLSQDSRCRIISGDFFALANSSEGFDPTAASRRFDAILIDIDHTPDWLLDERSGGFYKRQGLNKLARHLKPGGIMGLWSDAKPDDGFTARLASVFESARAEPVTFKNPLQNGQPYTQTVYLARKQ